LNFPGIKIEEIFDEDGQIYRTADNTDLTPSANRVSVSTLCPEHGISNTPFYYWRAKFSGIGASMIR
jgi:hypothetical protein